MSAAAAFEAASRTVALRLDARLPWLVRLPAASAALERAREALAGQIDPITAQVGAQRVALWEAHLARAEAAQASPSAQDVALAQGLTRARLLLHRYGRHFGGRPRATRDLGRLVEVRVGLTALHGALQTHREGADETLVAELDNLPRFVAMLVDEQGQISDGLARSGRLDQARALAVIAAELDAGWRAVVASAPPLARSPALMERALQSAAEVHERMAAVRHANLPDAHEEAIATLAERREAWASERARTLAAQAEASQAAIGHALAEAAQAELALVVAELEVSVDEPTSAPETSRAALCVRCDRIDALLDAVDEHGLDASALAGAGFDHDGLVDAAIWLGQRHDQTDPG